MKKEEAKKKADELKLSEEKASLIEKLTPKQEGEGPKSESELAALY